MNLTQFQTLSKRTMPFGGEPQNNQEFENMLGNYAMGLVGEIIELQMELIGRKDKEKIAYEIGDVAHYAIGLLTLANLEVPEHVEVPKSSFKLNDKMNSLLCNAGEIVEHSKKVIYHRHDFMKNIFWGVLRILSMLKDVAKHHGYKFSEVLDMNTEKLKTRYPDKFSVEDSIARVDTK